ncbi:MAG: HTTM domain-containing protein [Proteobacteria bacterium]|nr:HTTM domain-containing protein [Pseudomonadota bacterium]
MHRNEKAWTAWVWLQRPVPALPLDLFRICVGLLSFLYFLNLLCELPDFSHPNGLLDHALIQDIYWITRLGLFHPGIESGVLYATLGLACLGAWGIIVGYRIKLCAALLFIITVSSYRWNFMVMNVDDAIMHILLAWLLLLPVGQTLILSEWWQKGAECVTQWQRVMVPGLALRCFLGNVCLIYFVAGLWKFESPLWREGTALFAILQLPVAYLPDIWDTQHLPFLRIANYLALVFEPIIPVLLLVKRGHPLKYLGLAVQIGFHLFILVTLRIPFANLALLATPVLFFRDELMFVLRRWSAAEGSPDWQSAPLYPQYSRWPGRLAVILLFLLALTQTRRLPGISILYKPAAAVLWGIGIVQEYQLFNWIDRKNYLVQYPAKITHTDGQQYNVSSIQLFPSSLHAIVLQTYLYDVPWIPVAEKYRPLLKRSIMARSAQRYCRLHSSARDIVVSVQVQRIPSVAVSAASSPRFMMHFQCFNATAIICETMLDIEPARAGPRTKGTTSRRAEHCAPAIVGDQAGEAIPQGGKDEERGNDNNRPEAPQ